MIAEGKGQVARPPIVHRRGHPQRRSLDREAHVQPEVEGIYGPRLRIRLQPEGRGLVAASDHAKDPAPRKAMLRHGIVTPLEAIGVPHRPPAERVAERRKSRLPTRTDSGHAFAPLPPT